MSFWLKFNEPDLSAITGDDPKSAREATIDFVKAHRNWYAKWASIYEKQWNFYTSAIIILSAATSIVSAAGPGEITRWTSVGLSALSALLATILVQFRIRDLWQIREQGRIEAEEIIARAYLMPSLDIEAARKAAVEIKIETHRLEKKQARQFFSAPPLPKRSNETASEE